MHIVPYTPNPEFAPWSQRPFSNRRKLLQFHDNYRPAWYGLHQQAALAVRARRPWTRHAELDYEFDSDEEVSDCRAISMWTEQVVLSTACRTVLVQ
jgi:hypothetical protein